MRPRTRPIQQGRRQPGWAHQAEIVAMAGPERTSPQRRGDGRLLQPSPRQGRHPRRRRGTRHPYRATDRGGKRVQRCSQRGPLRHGHGRPPGYPRTRSLYEVGLAPFLLDVHTVTNDRFRGFVEATGHRTTAEELGTSFVFGGLLPDDFPPTRAVASAPWWREVEGANWRHPRGSAERPDPPRFPPCGPRQLVRRGRLLQVGRWATAHRSRMGAGGKRRRCRPPLPVGQRPRARWAAPDERLPGHLPRT